MVAVSGFDFVVIDCEHGPADVIALRPAPHDRRRPRRARPGPGRRPTNRPSILRALDQGASGIIAPHVDSAADARRLVDAAHYPRSGTAASPPTPGPGGSAPYRRRSISSGNSSETVVIGMIESPTGVRAAREILTVPGLDGTMIGTADLRASSTDDDPDPADSVVRRARGDR